ncbi:MAG: response regulator transcription factor [Alistipes putredinis]|nr:MAG: response regulator transcription factor [Alistipes putredinis]
MNADKTYRLAIIEPSEVVRHGLEAVLSSHGEFRVVASVDDAARCTERMSLLRPDAILMNPSVAERCGGKGASLKSMFPEFAGIAIVAFVYGLFSEYTLRQFDGVASVYDSGGAIASKIRKAMESAGTVSQNESSELSEREREILVSVAQGLTNKEIAQRHHISIYTVITHRKNITRKTGIKSVAGLTVYALLNNLINQSEMQ